MNPEAWQQAQRAASAFRFLWAKTAERSLGLAPLRRSQAASLLRFAFGAVKRPCGGWAFPEGEQAQGLKARPFPRRGAFWLIKKIHYVYFILD